MGKAAALIGLLLAGMLFTQFVGLTPAVDRADNSPFARKVNLALRRTAHHLLAEKGDSTSRIPPVQQTNATTFVIRLERPFDYGRLPTLLQQSLALHRIGTNYDVAVLDCSNGELQLGYNFLDYTRHNEVPCVGREQQRGCYTLQVTFAAAEPAPQPINAWWAGALGFILAGLGGFVWYRVAKTKGEPVAPQPFLPPVSSDVIRLGNTVFNPANLSLDVADTHHTLTYREAKLLRLFADHPNQVLERDFILKSVWEDEGIIVGRSADVFVSRLRKLLQNDPAVRINSVHGVGYRFVVEQAPVE
ncbi:Transcriptional regulatory protein rprY [Fibrisoma limi BUZ 3]|uniref:Transcriptional regulatory protein rprY n=1 Tax=Fibrisoma limi BUZ 3 TaxID=1185876 RepID=I2GDD8_9BACT|nr:winged helix-turn-helix domain-containing protein [Fibrisoma limi]CCH51912.1 Transcriptional regulatory protein rprY [Fibrisoma limi BUZ 3]